jgi:uncharacterized protein YhbP (UPF0306 family)
MADLKTLKQKTLDLIRGQSTMAFATAGNQGAWVAPVYYVFHYGGFYFFSDPQSRHIREALDGHLAAAAIYPRADTWKGIRGVQMSGRIRPAGADLRAIKALRAYIAKYPFTMEFFERGQNMDLENFSRRFKVRLYRLDPEVVYYLDNQIKFGFRKEITLNADD